MRLSPFVPAMRSIIIAACLAVIPWNLARADGLIYQLPKDGTSATFDMDFSVAGSDDHEKTTLTIGSVGVETVGDQNCRWIELVHKDQKAPTRMLIIKMLIPEEHIGKGKSPIDHVVRARVRLRDRGVREFTGREFSENYHAWFSSLPLLLGAVVKDAEVNELEPVEIDSKLGKLECAGVKGTYKTKIQSLLTRVTFETRFHDKAPFGVVTSIVRSEPLVLIDGRPRPTAAFRFTLSDTSDQSVSELPDKR